MLNSGDTFTSKALRRQVVSEVKLRRYFWNTVLSIGLIYLLGSMVFSDMGILRYLQLRDRQAVLEQELAAVMDQKVQLERRLDSLESDPFYIEKNARESFGMASPDEYVFIYRQ